MLKVGTPGMKMDGWTDSRINRQADRMINQGVDKQL
jgi:hypothetical protein